MDVDEPVRLGVGLLARIAEPSISLAEAMDRIELVTTDPTIARQILERAESEGIVVRDGSSLYVAEPNPLDFDADVIRREGSFTCRRCNSPLQEGWFLVLAGGELGPFGSTCIRYVTGRSPP